MMLNSLTTKDFSLSEITYHKILSSQVLIKDMIDVRLLFVKTWLTDPYLLQVKVDRFSFL